MNNIDERQVNCEKIWKILKKAKLNSENIWTIWKKGKLNSERYQKYGKTEVE
jgi:hypothetical protein